MPQAATSAPMKQVEDAGLGYGTGAKLEEMIAGLGPVEFCDIRVKPFRVEVADVVHGLIYECLNADDPEDPGATVEYCCRWIWNAIRSPPTSAASTDVGSPSPLSSCLLSLIQ